MDDHLKHQLNVIFSSDFDLKATVTIIDSLNVLYMNILNTNTIHFRELLGKKVLEVYESKSYYIEHDSRLSESERGNELVKLGVIFLKFKNLVWNTSIEDANNTWALTQWASVV